MDFRLTAIFGSPAKSNMEIIQRFQLQTLRITFYSRWFINIEAVHQNAELLRVQPEIVNLISKEYRNQLDGESNTLARTIIPLEAKNA